MLSEFSSFVVLVGMAMMVPKISFSSDSIQKRTKAVQQLLDGVLNSCCVPEVSEAVGLAVEPCMCIISPTCLFSGELLRLVFSYLEPVCRFSWLCYLWRFLSVCRFVASAVLRNGID